MSIQINFEIGHEASIRTKKTPEGFTHDWEVFVKGGSGTQLHYFVERVVFFLHETFPNPKRVVKQPPYVVKESGYAGFILPIEIHLKHTNEPKKIKFNYDLNLQTSGPAICKVTKEKYVFKNPNEEFRNCLLKGGGTPVSSNSFLESSDSRLSSDSKNELVNKPKLSGSDGMKQKHRNRMDDQRSSNSFQDLFGTPITKTNKIFSDPKSVPKDNTKSNSSNNNKSDKVSDKEKTSKDKSKFSPNKERDKDRDRDKAKEKPSLESTSERKKDRGGDEKKSKDKERKDRDRDHSKEKPSKRDKSPKPRSPSPKRPPSPPPKRSVTPPKYKEEKSTSKDRERKDKEEKSEKKSKKEKRDKEHKERKSREKEMSKVEKEHKEHKSKEKSAIKEQPEQKLEKVREKSKEFVEKENDKVDTPERFEKKPEERKEKHKHKKKDKEKKEKDKEKKEKDKERKEKEKLVLKMETKEVVKMEEKESLFSSPKGEDRKKLSLFSEDLSNSSMSSGEEEPLFEPAVKKLKSEDKPKKEKSKKSKDRKAEKEEKKRKRKAERSTSEERPPKIVQKEEPPVPSTTTTKLPQESTSDSEQAAVNVSVQTSNEVNDIDKENHDSPEEYMEVLRGLQLKIMNLQDNSELQKVVQMIAQTGQYEVSQRTFDFDLCLLDKGTVRQLQDFFESIP